MFIGQHLPPKDVLGLFGGRRIVLRGGVILEEVSDYPDRDRVSRR